MRVLLKLELDCGPDAAWNAIRNPEVFRAVSAPFTTFRSKEPGGFPPQWDAGDHPVEVLALGLIPIGEQVIAVSFPDLASARGKGRAPVRALRDSGRGVSGALAAVTTWRHTMAVSAAPGGKTLYRDELMFEAGVATPLLWALYWAFWQWRALRMRSLARSWG